MKKDPSMKFIMYRDRKNCKDLLYKIKILQTVSVLKD